jgi:hypothetical protein
LRFVSEPEDVRALLVPAKEPDAPVQPSKRGYALAHLAGWTLNLDRVGRGGLQALGRFVERTPCYGSAWTDAADAVTRLMATLQAAP